MADTRCHKKPDQPCGWDANIAKGKVRNLVPPESVRMLVLDTDHISVLERADSVERARLIHRLDQAGVTAVVTTIVSYEEQLCGWLKAHANSSQTSMPCLRPAG